MIAWGCGKHGENGRCQAYLLWLCGRLCESWRGRAGWEGHTTNKGGDCLPHLRSRVWKFEVGRAASTAEGLLSHVFLKSAFQRHPLSFRVTFLAPFLHHFTFFGARAKDILFDLHEVVTACCADVRRCCLQRHWSNQRPLHRERLVAGGGPFWQGRRVRRVSSPRETEATNPSGHLWSHGYPGRQWRAGGDLWGLCSDLVTWIDCRMFQRFANCKIVNTQYVSVSMSLEYTT